MIALVIYNPNPVLIKSVILFIYINDFREAWQEDKITSFYKEVILCY